MNTNDVPIQAIIDALLDEETTFNPRYLDHFSDLEGEDLEALTEIWPRISERRRIDLMRDLETRGKSDYLLSYEAVSRIAMHDPHPEVRRTAIRMLWEYEASDLIPHFLEQCRQDADPKVRAGFASALGKYVYQGEIEEIPAGDLREVEDQLLEITEGDDDAIVRRNALEALGFSSREEVPDLIERACQQGEPSWLASALFAMGRSFDRRWTSQVVDHLHHPEPAVRREAARAAGELEFKPAAPILVDLLGDAHDQVRAAAIWSLSQIGGEGIRETLEQLQEETDDAAEAELLEDALDNLSFTEDLASFDLFDFSEADLQELLSETDEADLE